MNPVLLSAQNLFQRYGEGSENTPALDNVSLTIGAGESVAIMGPSGSGKTTLLHCLAGIMTPGGGAVHFAAPTGPVRISDLSDRERTRLRREAFGFVFQQGLLIPELTAVENVALPLLLAGYPRREAEGRAQHWLVALGLGGMEGRRIGELSGGQAQRVAIARAQVTGAGVVFADEPTGALDTATSVEVMDALLGSTVGQGHTLVVVTHNEDVAARCARIVRLRDGRIVSDEKRAPDTGPAFVGAGWAVDPAVTGGHAPVGPMPGVPAAPQAPYAPQAPQPQSPHAAPQSPHAPQPPHAPQGGELR